MTSGFVSFLRFTLGIAQIPNPVAEGNWYSDLGKASAIWFWRIT